MNRFVKYGIAGFVGLGVLGAIIPDQTPNNSTAAVEALENQANAAEAKIADNTKQITAVEKALKKEPKIKDLLHDSGLAVQWTVGVITDGTPRFGYASYVCEVIKEGGAMETDGSTYVRVVDVVKVANGESPRSASLGQVRCDDYEVIER